VGCLLVLHPVVCSNNSRRATAAEVDHTALLLPLLQAQDASSNQGGLKQWLKDINCLLL
jgi:hypothetical protein